MVGNPLRAKKFDLLISRCCLINEWQIVKNGNARTTIYYPDRHISQIL